MRKVKIVCTLGPSTPDVSSLVKLIEAGMDGARLNFSHGAHEQHRRMFAMVREASQVTGKPVAILGDLCGPKIRIGEMVEGGAMLEDGALVRLTTEAVVGDAQRLPHCYPPLARDVSRGDPVLINDGLVELRVEEVEGNDVVCRVAVGGGFQPTKA